MRRHMVATCFVEGCLSDVSVFVCKGLGLEVLCVVCVDVGQLCCVCVCCCGLRVREEQEEVGSR